MSSEKFALRHTETLCVCKHVPVTARYKMEAMSICSQHFYCIDLDIDIVKIIKDPRWLDCSSRNESCLHESCHLYCLQYLTCSTMHEQITVNAPPLNRCGIISAVNDTGATFGKHFVMSCNTRLTFLHHSQQCLIVGLVCKCLYTTRTVTAENWEFHSQALDLYSYLCCFRRATFTFDWEESVTL